MLPENEKIALFDLDGTLADYDGQIAETMQELYGEDWKDFPDDWKETARHIITSQEGWFRNLKPLELGMFLFRGLGSFGFKRHILTQGPRTKPQAWQDKLIWCQEHLGEDIDVTITRDKGLVYGKILVDDFPSYITRWLEWRPRGGSRPT